MQAAASCWLNRAFPNLNPSFAGCSSSGHLLPYWNKRNTQSFRAPGWSRCGLFLFIRTCLNFTSLGFLFNFYVCERALKAAANGSLCIPSHAQTSSPPLPARLLLCGSVRDFFLSHSDCCSFTAISMHRTVFYAANQELLISLVISVQLHSDESRGC